MTEAMEPRKARFYCLDSRGKDRGTGLLVHFNPKSLVYSVMNTLDQKHNSPKKKQFVSQSSAKLTMQLVYDTTDSGRDVRQETEKIAQLMQPRGRRRRRRVQVVRFSWGAFSFKGMFETYTETIEFFSTNGVPLRAKLDIGLASQDDVFEFGGAEATAPRSVDVHPANGLGAANAAAQAGDPASARDVAQSNGLESVRFGAGAAITVVEADSLRPPSAFSSGGALSSGSGAGAQVSLGGGAAGAGVGVSVSGTFGASSSAGITASAGAFAGLRGSARPRPVSLRLDELRPERPFDELATDEGASFGVGGQAFSPGSGGLSTDVGIRASLQTRIQFDGE